MSEHLLQIGERDQIWVDSMQERLTGQCSGLRFRHRADTIFLLVMGGRVLTMQTGFAMLESAYGEKMNAANIMMKNTMDLLCGALGFFFLGYTLAYDEKTQWDEENNFDFAMWFAQFSYATTAATIDSGALAGRVAFSSYVVFSICVTGIIYPLGVRMTWGGGWLHEMGFIDFAGSSIVHMVGSVSACVSALLLGPRIGRFPDYRVGSKLWRLLSLNRKSNGWYQGPLDEVEKAIFVKPRNITNPVQALFGLFVLIIGFLAFNPGSTLATTGDTDLLGARTTVTTLLASSGGAFACIAGALVKTRVPNITIPDFVTGILASLVASCACCHVVTPLVSICIGFIAALVALLCQEWVDYFQVDDPVGAIAVHGPPGVVGTLSVAIFAKPHCLNSMKGLVYGGGAAAWEQLGTQCVGVLVLAGFAAVSTYILVIFIDVIWGFRCDRSAELIGLDYTEHSYDDGSYTADQNKVAFLEHSPIKKYSLGAIANPAGRSWNLGQKGGSDPGDKGSDKPQKRSSDGNLSSASNFTPLGTPLPDGRESRDTNADVDEVAELRKQVQDLRREMSAMKEYMSRPSARVNAVQQLRHREDQNHHHQDGSGFRTLQQLAMDFSGSTSHPAGSMRNSESETAG
mmetsp:Transcript_2929/g.6378  ORF Transcript_2929/g.6378 Transcript_2929/m.6378 type:complete len:629 (-) Transcript_2929:195-2081(-)